MTRQGVGRTAAADHEKGTTLTQVRTTITPDTVLEVGDAELIDLKRSGLIQSHEAIDEKSPTGVAVAGAGLKLGSPKRWKAGDAEDNAAPDLATPPNTDDTKGTSK